MTNRDAHRLLEIPTAGDPECGAPGSVPRERHGANKMVERCKNFLGIVS